MRVVTWNIEFGRNAADAADELTTLPELASADIILLQEMDGSGTKLIANVLEADFVFAAAATHPETGRDLGNAIVSSWPIRDAIEIELPHVASVAGQARSAIHAIVDVGENRVSTYSVHTETVLLPLSKRRQQFVTVADHVRTLDDGAAVVVGGDFNTARSREIDALTSILGAVDLQGVSQRSGPTFRRFGRGFTLDHVFARGFITNSCGVAHDATASDHLPVWAELLL